MLQDNLSASGAQLRLTYTDNSVYTNFTTDSSGNLTIAPTGTKAVFSTDIQVNGNDIRGSDGVARLTLGETNSITGRLSVANNGRPAQGAALGVFDQYENQDIFTASDSGTPRFVIQKGGNVGTSMPLLANR